VIPKHQSRLKTWKADNYQVIGYVCRSPKEENEQDRINILQTMVGHLVVRHLIDKVFVSSQSKISDLLSERDKETQQEFMEKLTGVNGDTQGM
jgi:hypothetical protein